MYGSNILERIDKGAHILQVAAEDISHAIGRIDDYGDVEPILRALVWHWQAVASDMVRAQEMPASDMEALRVRIAAEQLRDAIPNLDEMRFIEAVDGQLRATSCGLMRAHGNPPTMRVRSPRPDGG